MIDQAWVTAKRTEIATLKERTQQEINGLVDRMNRLEGGDIVLREIEKTLAGDAEVTEAKQ